MTEELWAGEFGDDYTGRNSGIGPLRRPFWSSFLSRYPVDSVIELGCGSGNNLMHLRVLVPTVIGLDANETAVEEARCLGVRVIQRPATDVPYPDSSFQLSLVAGLLIHISDDELPRVMDELHRLSDRYLMVMEYDAPTRTEVVNDNYAPGTLIKRPFDSLFQERFPDLTLKDTGFLPGPAEETGWDDLTYWLYVK